MSDNEYKTGVGVVVGTIILLLNLFSILCELFNTEIVAFVSLSELVRDSSGFQTMICVSFILFVILKGNKSFATIVVHIVDIVLANKFYSNSKWKDIIEDFNLVNKNTIILSIFFGLLSVYLLYIFVSKYREHKIQKKEKIVQAEGIDKQQIIHITELDNDSDEKDMGETTTNIVSDQRSGKNSLLIGLCISVIAWACLDYIVYSKSLIKINRPEEMEWIPNILYYIAIICAAFLVKEILCNKIINWDKTKNFLDVKSPAVLALFLEILLVIVSSKLKWGKISNLFLNIISDNWFSTIFAFIIFFMIIHIGCTIVMDMLLKKTSDDELAEILKKKIKKVEKKMVKLACNIIDGCISLLDFIPDFFDTIGFLLLNQTGKSSNKNQKKGENENED